MKKKIFLIILVWGLILPFFVLKGDEISTVENQTIVEQKEEVSLKNKSAAEEESEEILTKPVMETPPQEEDTSSSPKQSFSNWLSTRMKRRKNFLKSRVKTKSKKIGIDILSFTNFKAFKEPVTQKNLDDISFIVKSCAKRSTVAIAMSQGEIEDALMRIQEVHPLNILKIILSNENLKNDFIIMRSRSWIWNVFVGKIKEIFSVMAAKNLLKEEDVNSFSEALGLDKNIVFKKMKNQEWSGLLDFLVKSL